MADRKNLEKDTEKLERTGQILKDTLRDLDTATEVGTASLAELELQKERLGKQSERLGELNDGITKSNSIMGGIESWTQKWTRTWW